MGDGAAATGVLSALVRAVVPVERGLSAALVAVITERFVPPEAVPEAAAAPEVLLLVDDDDDGLAGLAGVRPVCPLVREGPASDELDEDPPSAHATAGRAAIPAPTPSAIASAPTRPTYRAELTRAAPPPPAARSSEPVAATVTVFSLHSTAPTPGAACA
ncbi:hypothetical protein MANY_31540 [Mycolicibacterium anyangense]|uniref:Uncharacterized protein n=1 Tax=Mycolicibacterium anyangense TaxID=1431246 RepID=A0A6N4WC84_9MYCO|nr:hypothetical protein MANY_31540 [Mycolicibacterium anyangense]